jgi:hypothetical protein
MVTILWRPFPPSLGASTYAEPTVDESAGRRAGLVCFAPSGRGRFLGGLVHNSNVEEKKRGKREREQKLVAAHCMPGHTHILIGLKP